MKTNYAYILYFTANRLNYVTKQIDIDLYGDAGGKIKVEEMDGDIDIILERMTSKDKSLASIPKTVVNKVNVTDRLAILTARNKPPIIYHQLNVTRPYSSINVQILLQDPEDIDIMANTDMLLMARHGKMPLVKECDFVKIVSSIDSVDEDYLDWYLGSDEVQNRTGGWYFGVTYIALDKGDNLTNGHIVDMETCQNSGLMDLELDKTFGKRIDQEVKSYNMRMYTAGLYYFDIEKEDWEGMGIKVKNTSQVTTAGGTNHLTSFATGFFPEPNAIDFDFVFSHASFSDNLTIFILLIVSLMLYFILMIWATLKDKKDNNALPVPVMRDNYPDDKYFYEIIVETGPKDADATTANINFILSGSDCDTEIRCFSDDERQIFKKGARDGFLMAVAHPLGDLEYMRIWTDSSGLGEMSAWYLLSVIVHNVQTGQVNRFVADQWLAIDRGTFEDDITIPASGGKKNDVVFYRIYSDFFLSFFF